MTKIKVTYTLKTTKKKRKKDLNDKDDKRPNQV